MEPNNSKINSREVRQTLFLILLAIAIGSLLFTCITLVRNAEEIKSDPVEYAISNDFYDSCTCFKDEKIQEFGNNNLYSNEINHR